MCYVQYMNEKIFNCVLQVIFVVPILTGKTSVCHSNGCNTVCLLESSGFLAATGLQYSGHVAHCVC